MSSALIPALASTVTVVDNSGKVLNTSKNLFSAFKEAREAYRTRKAEILAERQAEKEARQRRREKRERRERREREKAEGKRHKKERKKRRPSGSSVDGETGALAFDLDENEEDEVQMESLSRKSSRESLNENDATLDSSAPLTLADGPSDMAEDAVTDTLQMLLSQLQATIDELSCITFGITTLITELQKCPDTLAVVGLTLAEISTLVTKVAPGLVLTLKTAFPVIFGLLSSPQFAVVASVGMAATVVLLGGYKIIRNVIVGGEEQKPQVEELEMGGVIQGEVLETNLLEAPLAAASATNSSEPVSVVAETWETPKDKEKEKEKDTPKEKEKRKKVKALPVSESPTESQSSTSPPSLTRKSSKRDDFFAFGKHRKKSKDLSTTVSSSSSFGASVDSVLLAFDLEKKDKEKREKERERKEKEKKEKGEKGERDRKERKKSTDEGSVFGDEKVKSRKKSDAGSIFGDEKARLKKSDEASVVGDERPKLKKRNTLKHLFEGRSM